MRVKTARRGGQTRHIIIDGNHDDQEAADLYTIPIPLDVVAQGETLYNTLAAMDYRVFRVVARHFIQWGIDSLGVVRTTGSWPGRLRTVVDDDPPSTPIGQESVSS